MIAYHYLDWVAQSENIKIDHKLNSGKEHRVCGYYLDGFNAGMQTAWEFLGCWFHGHEHVWMGLDVDDKKRQMLQNRLKRTKARTQILRDHGITVVEKWECEFRQEMKSDPALWKFVASRQPAFFQHTGIRPQTVESLLDGVKSGVLFGFVTFLSPRSGKVNSDRRIPQTSILRNFRRFFVRRTFLSHRSANTCKIM